MNKKAHTTKTYNDHAQQFYKKFENSGPRITEIDRAFDLVNKVNPKVLELGCAYGREANIILQKTSDYLGIDIAPEFIKLAQKNNKFGHFEIADLETFPFPSNLDIIFAFATLLHCDYSNVQDILNRSYDALNSGGIIYLSLKYGSHQEQIKQDEHGKRYYYLYSPEDIREMTKNKFSVVYEGFYVFRKEDWFGIILKKNTASL